MEIYYGRPFRKMTGTTSETRFCLKHSVTHDEAQQHRDNNNIGNDGSIALADYLTHNASLKVLFCGKIILVMKVPRH